MKLDNQVFPQIEQLLHLYEKDFCYVKMYIDVRIVSGQLRFIVEQYLNDKSFIRTFNDIFYPYSAYQDAVHLFNKLAEEIDNNSIID